MTDDPSSDLPRPSEKIDTTVPHSARIWNYWLGGKDNYQVDREAGDEYKEIFPGIVDVARSSRYFLARAVRFLAGEAGIRQFLDIGTGLPTVDNTHEVAQRVAPESRTVYVDNDPLVLVYARALLTGSAEGSVDYIDADVREPGQILDKAGSLLDFGRPLALMLMGIMGHIPDEEAYPIVRRLLDGLPSGSYFALYDGANVNKAFDEAQRGYNDSGAVPYHLPQPRADRRFLRRPGADGARRRARLRVAARSQPVRPADRGVHLRWRRPEALTAAQLPRSSRAATRRSATKSA